MQRPFLWLALMLVAGVVAADVGQITSPFLPVMAGFLGLATALLPFRMSRAQPFGLALTFLAIGMLAWQVRHTGPPGDALSRAAALQPGAQWTLEGRVRRAQLLGPGDEYLSFIIDVERAGVGFAVGPMEGRVEARWFAPDGPVFVDDYVRVTGPLRDALGEVNFGVSGYEDYLRRLGVHSAIRLRGPSAVHCLAPGRWWRPSHLASTFRHGQAERLARAIPKDAQPFILAVWLGDSYSQGPHGYDVYVESGTAHIFSVSGLHMAIIYASASTALRSVVRRRRLRIGICLGAVWLYALLTGAQVACLRSATMISIYLVAEMLEREPDGPTALSLAAIGFLLYNANLLYDIGFQLSFLSIASIMLYSGPLAERFRRLPRWLGASMATSLAAQILPLPVAVYTFHVVPLYATIANLLVVPILTLVLWLCFATSLLAMISIDVASLFGYALWPLVAAIHALASAVVSVPGSSLRLTNPTTAALVFYAVTSIALLMALGTPTRSRSWWLVVAGALAMTVVLWQPYALPAEVVFLDVGHGDASFIRTESGSTVLIDGGNRTDSYDQGRRVVAPFLWANHTTRLDYVVGTHEDADHIGGLAYIMGHFPVGCLVLPPNPKPGAGERELLSLCATRGVPVRRITCGGKLDLGGAMLEALHPPLDWPASHGDNDGSLVMRLSWNGPSVLFPGDVEAVAERRLALLDCRADLMKAPHHGSRTSSSLPFLEAVGAAHAIVSTGLFRGRESANPEVMRRYESAGIRTWRTDRLGAIRVRMRGHAYELTSAREAREVGFR